MKTVIFSLLLCSSVFAQKENLQSAFISANMGIFYIDNDQFDKVYNSNLGFMPGITLGLPLTTRAYLFCKVSYFAKSGIPSVYIPGSEGMYIKSGNAEFKQWLVNAGLMYNFFLSEDYTLNINFGLFFLKFKEHREDQDGNSLLTASGGGNPGVFGGIGIERNFNNSPFSLVGETQYSMSAFKAAVGGGLNINIGGRYYFRERRKQ